MLLLSYNFTTKQSEVSIPTLPKQVQHCFMAENVPFKQRHLQGILEADGSGCCIFHDATKVCTDDRECIVHHGCCETRLINLVFFISVLLFSFMIS